MGKKKTGFGLRMAFGGETPSALERRLNDRLNSGTLTVRGAGMLSDIENQRRGDATQRYGVDTQAGTARYGVDAQSATARMNDATQRFGIGTQADTARYGVDAQSATARMNDATQRFGIGTQADTARYGVDAQSATARMNDATQRYGVDTQADTSRYGYDTSAATARMNDATQRYGVDTQADTARYGVDAQSATAKMNNTTNLLGMNLQADTQRYGMDSNLLSNMWRMKNGGEIQPVRLGLRNGGEIHAADGFARGGFAERASSVRWLSPRDQMDYQARMAGVDADLALKNEQLRQEQESFVSPRDLKDKEARDRYYQQQAAHKNQAIDEKRYQDKFGLEKQRADMEKQRFDREMAASAMTGRGTVGTIAQQNAQLDLDMKKAQLAEYNKARFMQDASPDIKNGGKALGTSWGGGGYVGGQRVGYAPQEAQDSARLNERRSMYDKALRGHFNAGGFGAVRPPVNAAPSNFGMPRGYGLRDGGDMLQTGQGGKVPGTGKGDKIPAKYEPGEFVVSNDMLAAEPELRDHLRALREQVLAAKGMTPEEADAKAIKVEGGGKEQKAGKKGFGIRAEGSFDGFFGPDFFGNKELDKRLAEGIAAQQAAEDAERNRVLVDARGNPRVGLDKWLDVTNGYTDVTKKADSSTPDVGDGGARDRQRPVEKAVQAATPDSRSQDFRGPVMDDSQITRPSAKDTPPVLQGATGKDVGFGITRFNVPGQSPLFTNMTDEDGMASNNALINRKPQSDQDRIAGDNLSNRFAQRADAEARMAQRQAELQAEYERGQVDNRAIASSERQRELLNEQRNLERKIPRQEEAAGVNARIAALEKARLGEGENFGARENALVLDQARNAATIGVHAGDRASIERVADKELAAKAPGYALDNELSRQKIAAAQELKDLRDEYGKTNDPAKKAAIAERVRWLTGGKAEGGDHFDAKVLTDKNLNESLVTWDKRNGRIGPAGGGQGNRQATKEQVIAAANAKGITDPAALQQLFKHYGVE